MSSFGKQLLEKKLVSLPPLGGGDWWLFLRSVALCEVPQKREEALERLLSLKGREEKEAVLAFLEEEREQVLGDLEGGREDAERLACVLEWLKAEGLEGYLLSMGGEFSVEWPALCERHILWLTGFRGSAGLLLLGVDERILWIDGRYALQASREVDTAVYRLEDKSRIASGLKAWARGKKKGVRVGYDSRLYRSVSIFEKALGEEVCLVPISGLGSLWACGIPRPVAMVERVCLCGRTTAEKVVLLLEAVRSYCKEEGVEVGGILLWDAENVSWLLNLRSYKTTYYPVFEGRVLLSMEGGLEVFTDEWGGREVLEGVARVFGLEKFEERIRRYSGDKLGGDGGVSLWVRGVLKEEGVGFCVLPDFCLGYRAVKTEEELRALEGVQVLDGLAVTHFLYWVKCEAVLRKVTEVMASRYLLSLRKRYGGGVFLGESFPAISAFGSNGAIVHYRACEETALILGRQGLYLIDSGGQYCGGTTDITRTVVIGEATEEMKRCYTAVLRGHIELSRCRFPPDTSFRDLEVLARSKLWQEGLNYRHGTGHGVGAGLSVHEALGTDVPYGGGKKGLRGGMVLTNEPGFYKEGSFGIRIENMMCVEEKGADYFGFRPLTLVPYERELIIKELLTKEEKEWINAYHGQVLQVLGGKVPSSVLTWLKTQTHPL